MGSLTMTLSPNTLLSLLSILATVTSIPGGYWWMGKEGAFGSQPNNKISPSLSPSPAPQISGGDAGGGGGGYYGNDYGNDYGNNNQPTEDFSASSSPSLPVVSPDSGEDLPVTECPVGWKCVSELFCDATATMVSQRVQLSKAQVAIRGNLIQCMNPATAQFNVCCRQPQAQLSPQISPSPSVSPVPDRTEVEEAARPSEASCPVISVLPPIQLCANRKSTCWSAGQADVDCLDNALCCFDGCANVCLGRGPVPANPGPQTIARQTTPAPSPVITQENFAEKIPSNLASNIVASSPQMSTQPPVKNNPAAAQPFLRCPSAMKCVPKINCDFNGVMVNTRVFLSPIQEKQRVPLIPCVNSARGNNVDVCCRDPNYKDPWPEMNTKKNSKTVVKKSPGQPNIAINQRVSSPQKPLNNRNQPLGYGR